MSSFHHSSQCADSDNSVSRLFAYLESQSSKRTRRPTTVARLDKTIQMRSQAMSATIAMSGHVDLDSVNKGQASRVDMTKLAKAEAKIKAKIEKRSKRQNLYEGSRLLESAQSKETYEELFMKVNPLDLSGAGRSKSKDVNLDGIDISVGNTRIL